MAEDGVRRRRWGVYGLVGLAVVLAVMTAVAVSGALVGGDGGEPAGDPAAAEGDGASPSPSPVPPEPPPDHADPEDADAETDRTDEGGAVPVGYQQLPAGESLFETVPASERTVPEGCGEVATSPGSEGQLGSCLIADGSGGTFAVVERAPGDTRRSYEVLRSDGRGWQAVLATDEIGVGGLPEDWLGVFVRSVRSEGEPGVIVSYAPSAASGLYPTFELITWEDEAEAPSVVAVVNGGNGAFLRDSADGFELFEPNYDDGAPNCCPNDEDVWDVRRVAPGVWAARVTTRPIEAIGSGPGESVYLD